MDLVFIGGAVLLLLVIIYFIIARNRLVNLRINVERQASHVDVYLKKRYDLIPALVEVVKGYAKHERETLEEVARLRSAWTQTKSSEEKLKISNKLDSTLGRLLLIQERYPALKADRSFISLQRSLVSIEYELARERVVYNKRVSWYNVKLQEFPTMIVAILFQFKPKLFFSISES